MLHQPFWDLLWTFKLWTALILVSSTSDQSSSPPRYVLAPPGGLKGYAPIQDFIEARKATSWLGIRFAQPRIYPRGEDPDNVFDVFQEDPHGAVYREDDDIIYFNVHKGNNKGKQSRKIVYKKSEKKKKGPSTGADIPRLIDTTGVLYHPMGFAQGTKFRPWRMPKEVLEYWKSNPSRGIYQQSSTYLLNTSPHMLPSKVGLILDPENPKVFIHMMGMKDLFYWPSMRKFPGLGKLEYLCKQYQGLAEAGRAIYNAYNWRYATFINGCYATMIAGSFPEETNAVRFDAPREERVRYFLGSPIGALKDTWRLERILQIEAQMGKKLPRQPRNGKEHCEECLWNDIIFSAPTEAIIGVVLFADDPNQQISPFDSDEPKNNVAYWFRETCVGVKKMNPTAKCYNVYKRKLRELPNGEWVFPPEPGPAPAHGEAEPSSAGQVSADSPSSPEEEPAPLTLAGLTNEEIAELAEVAPGVASTVTDMLKVVRIGSSNAVLERFNVDVGRAGTVPQIADDVVPLAKQMPNLNIASPSTDMNRVGSVSPKIIHFYIKLFIIILFIAWLLLISSWLTMSRRATTLASKQSLLDHEI